MNSSFNATVFNPLAFDAAMFSLSLGDYALEGPSTATVGLASDQFFVTLGADTVVFSVGITPDDGGAGGSFSVAEVVLTSGARSLSFTYTAAAAGTVTISVTNDGGLANPDPITLLVSNASSPVIRGGGPIVMLTPAPARWYGRG